MRIGQNPSKVKGSPAYQPARIGLASLTYVPALEGYFKEALDVIDVHLASLRASMEQDYDLCVFDNGSCPEVIRYLEEQRQAGWIDWLCLSNHNLGKNGALNWIFAALPNEFIAYSDSDVFFRKGWLESSLAIFDSFEKAGMVSAQPVFFDFLKGEGQTARQVTGHDGYTVQNSRPRPEVVEEYCDGINASEELRRQFRAQELQVAINTSTGVRAVTSATDMQFMLRKRVADELLPFPIVGALTGIDAIEIPRRIEKQGYWLLSTGEPLVWHMGNSLQGAPTAEIEAVRTGLGVEPADPVARSAVAQEPGGLKRQLKTRLSRAIRRSPTLKRATERLYSGLFGILYEEKQP